MRTLTLAFAAFTAVPLLLAQVPAASAAQSLQTKQTSVKKMQVRSAAEIKRSFGLAARQRGAQAIEISCSPGSSEHCSGDFVAACDKNGGGMSTNPDGSVTCSLPQHD